ncbi:MAG TPA: polysaccharide biosynthesis tyrosine autokinase [Nevskiaceae bacterium]|nr:polysaccharide biosynthesis tyrosine autokinase [Nevskiaceae bacterium]
MQPPVSDRPLPPPPEPDLIDLPELWRTLSRYRWGIVSITVLVALCAALVAFSLPKIYRASATVLIEPRAKNVVQVDEVYDPGFGTSEYYFTQYEILRSRELAEQVVERLRLTEVAEFNGALEEESLLPEGLRALTDWRQWLPFLPEEEEAELSDEQALRLLRETTLGRFSDALTVLPVPRTQLVRIYFDSRDPELAAQVSNTLADVFIESALQSKLDASRKATEWLTQKLEDIRLQLEASEKKLQTYREQQQLVNVGGSRTLVETELVENARRLREAQERAGELQNAYSRIQQAGGDPRRLQEITALQLDPLVQAASRDLIQAQEAARQLEERYGAKHPQMVTANARLDTARKAYQEQLRIASQGLRNQLEVARDNVRSLSARVEQGRSQVRGLDKQGYELGVLERDVQTNRELYDLFLSRFKETDTSGDYDGLQARVVDPAVPPLIAAEPQKKRIVLLSALAGLAFALLLTLLRHLLSETVKSPEELEQLVQLPVFGVLPKVGGLTLRRSLSSYFSEQPRTPYAEGIRSVRASLQLADPERRLRRLLLTSSVPREGKSSLASTLALSLAGQERVLLIEADLRRPSLRREFGWPAQQPGLSDVLAGKTELAAALYAHPSGLTVLAAGSRHPNPAELLSDPAFARLIQQLAQDYDRLLFDCPPCQAGADAQLLSQHADAALFVVRSDQTSRRAVKQSLRQLQAHGARVLGLLINQVDVRRNPYYRDGYSYAYGYYG